MKRGKVLLFFLVLTLVLSLPLFSYLIFAAEQDHAEIGYDCLQSSVENKGCSNLNFEEKVFSLLAAKLCQAEIEQDMDINNNCWPKSSCKVNETSQAIISLSAEGEFDTTKAEEWLLTRTKAAEGLDWFLEVDVQDSDDLPSSCTVKYDSDVYRFQVLENRKLNSNAGPCLQVTSGSYWFKIQPGCFEKEFKITCDKAFFTTLLFKKQDSTTIYVSDNTITAEAVGETIQKVNFKCFQENGKCTYVGTLWATFALWAQGRGHETINQFTPYLTAMKEGNERFLPDAFLYFITGEEDFYLNLLDKQKNTNWYWEVSENRYYDTALAMWPLKYDDSPQKGYGIDWLLTTQESTGCWNGGNIRDTAFILRSVWPEYAPECQNDDDCLSSELCNTTTNLCYYSGTGPGPGYKCEIDDDCDTDAGEVCSLDGICVDSDDCTETCESEEYECGTVCGEDCGDCGDDENCEDGICVEIITCSWFKPCPDGYDCIDNVCVPEEEPDICEIDDDCDTDAGEVCGSDGVCYVPEEAECGNGDAEFDEQCDGNDLRGKDCSDIISGWTGTLGCDNNCDFDTSACEPSCECEDNYGCGWDEICVNCECIDNPEIPSECGNDDAETDEECDGSDLKGKDCSDIFSGSDWTGTLSCYGTDAGEDYECTFDTSSCEPPCECEDDYACGWGEKCVDCKCIDPSNPPECGNDDAETDEECDGSDLKGNDCSDVFSESGYTGTLSCYGTDAGEDYKCTFDTSGCIPPGPVCECEDDYACGWDEVCNGCMCVDDPDILPVCENGVKEEGEMCDGYDHNGETCESILGVGWTGTLHCTSDCGFDTSDCTEDPGYQKCIFNWQCGSGETCEGGRCVPELEPEEPCDTDFDCEDDEVCEGGECIPDTGKDPCYEDDDCPGSMICNSDGECVKDPNGSDECFWDEDCNHPNETCEDGVCINETEEPECTKETEDYDCWFGEICLDGVCVPEDTECFDDDDCPGTQECVAGNCISPNSTEPEEPVPCEDDNDCPYWDQSCIEGFCSDNDEIYCEDEGYFCMASSSCTGNIYPLYTCVYPFECCDTSLPSESCFEQGGYICLSDEICVGGIEVNSSDLDYEETCCINEGYCVKKGSGANCTEDDDCYSTEECVGGICVYKEEEPDCEDHDGHCRPGSCLENEKESYVYTCAYEDSCCISKESGGGGGVWLIIILLILIALVVAGIIFRDKLKVYWMKVKSKFEKGKKPGYGRRPGAPPGMLPPGKTPGKPKKKNPFKEFWEKLKAFFTGKKSRTPSRQIPQRPLRGPLAIQHAQRQGQMPSSRPGQTQRFVQTSQREPIRPGPSKPTSTAFSKEESPKSSKEKDVKKPEKKPKKSHKELNEILDKLKKMGN